MEQVLLLFKLNLGINSNQKDDYFNSLLESSNNELKNRGIYLNLSSIEDIMLLVDYTAWNYRNRNEDVPMPKNIELRLMNRKVERRIIRDD